MVGSKWRAKIAAPLWNLEAAPQSGASVGVSLCGNHRAKIATKVVPIGLRADSTLPLSLHGLGRQPRSSIAVGVRNRMMSFLAAAALAAVQVLPSSAWAENRMGYQLLSPQAAASLPRRSGSLGAEVERAQQITDGGMTFDIIRVKSVRRGSPAAQAGLALGDEIIAVNGQVFPSLATFAEYIGSVQPGTVVNVDYIPAHGGPAQAQRVAVTVGEAGRSAASSPGMSTGAKVAIGVGAAALLGCYEMGCFSHRKPGPAAAGNRIPDQPMSGPQQPNGRYQQPGFQRQ